MPCVLVVAGCPGLFNAASSDSIFDTAPVVETGAARETTIANIGALGTLDAGDTAGITVTGESAHAVLVLLRESDDADTALLVGGGPANERFVHRVNRPGTHFVFVLYRTDTPESEQTVTATVDRDWADVEDAVSQQPVVIQFEEGFLTEPGLFDPVDGTNADREFLLSIESTVRSEVVSSLRRTFEDTPIEVLDAAPAGDEPFSTVIFSPQRILAESTDIHDAALPPPDPTRPECQARVVFGEVLPQGTDVDPGNRVRDDSAVVYVGSFQGRGRTCWTSAVSSLNNVVLTLSQTAAHEIGHLVGLFHVEQIDLMNRSATLAFLRDLEFARGQIQLDRIRNGEIVSEVFPEIIQEPQAYFDAVFTPASSAP